MTVQTPPLPVPSVPRPGGPLAVHVTPRLQDVVQQLGVAEPTHPPVAPLLPPGAVPLLRIHEPGPDVLPGQREADAVTDLLGLLGLPAHDLFAVGGMVVWGMSCPTPVNDYWVSVDYQTGAVNPTGDPEGRKAAAAGLLLNHEAGRCHPLHPLADHPALDRRYAPVPHDLPRESVEPLRGLFVSTGARQLFVRADGTPTASRDLWGSHQPTWLHVLAGRIR